MTLTKTIARIATVIPLSLTLLAGSAAAECAWVLWDYDRVPLPRGRVSKKMWIVVSGHQSLPDCEVKRKELAKDIELAMKEYDKMIGEKASEPYNSGLVCLPDTIDPRGPKGR